MNKKIIKTIILTLLISSTLIVLPKTDFAVVSTTKIGDICKSGSLESTNTLLPVKMSSLTAGNKVNTNVGANPTNITLKQIDRTVPMGTSLQLDAIVTPTNAKNTVISWTSSNSQIASVSTSGVVYAVKPGNVTIIAKTSNNKTATCIIRVNIPAKSISINKSSTTINKGNFEKLTVNFNPTNTSSKEIKWESLNPKIATVNSSGVVTTNAKGTATIKAISKYGKTATCKVTVTDYKYIEDEKITVNGRIVTKAQYANFRNVSGGKLGKNVLFRCLNPIHGQTGSNGKYAQAGYYADQMLKEHKVKAILNLDNNSSTIKQSSYPKSTYYRSLFNAGKVCARSISGVSESSSWRKEIVDRVRFFAKNEGPYAVHCWIGRDRTGFVIILLECLMNVPFENMYNDFIKSDENFRNTGRFDNNTISGFSKALKIITGRSAADKKHPKASDWKNVNLVKCAENYLRYGGMTNSEIQKLKINLAKNY